jgi:hypothetical protein
MQRVRLKVVRNIGFCATVRHRALIYIGKVADRFGKACCGKAVDLGGRCDCLA